MTTMLRTPHTEATTASVRARASVPSTLATKWFAIVPGDANADLVRHHGTTGGPGGSS